jgi:hypothetical protein
MDGRRRIGFRLTAVRITKLPQLQVILSIYPLFTGRPLQKQAIHLYLICRCY